MFKEITVLRISAGTLFKLASLGMVLTLIPFGIIMGCFAFFGAATVKWNNEALTGFTGLVASPFIGALLAAIFTMVLGTCMTFGLWLWSRFQPLTLLVKVPGERPGA